MKKLNILMFFFLITALSFAVVGMEYTRTLPLSNITSEYIENIDEEDLMPTLNIEAFVVKAYTSGGNDFTPTLQTVAIDTTSPFEIFFTVKTPIFTSSFIQFNYCSNFLLDYIQSLHFT